ncbi:MAG: hypothetical protein EHM35_15500 [Planctomycetaceae bacterium]|nr:MAG: hypothetical protein EHM35_15500 [Planctomycetaceae bacterium]
MAITWEIKITNVQVATKRANVTATRTDGASALPPQVYSFTEVPIGTPAERLSLINTIKTRVTERASHNAQVEDTVADLEAAGKTALESWELTR